MDDASGPGKAGTTDNTGVARTTIEFAVRRNLAAVR
jgi:hypothetical protein